MYEKFKGGKEEWNNKPFSHHLNCIHWRYKSRINIQPAGPSSIHTSRKKDSYRIEIYTPFSHFPQTSRGKASMQEPVFPSVLKKHVKNCVSSTRCIPVLQLGREGLQV